MAVSSYHIRLINCCENYKQIFFNKKIYIILLYINNCTYLTYFIYLIANLQNRNSSKFEYSFFRLNIIYGSDLNIENNNKSVPVRLTSTVALYVT